MILLLFYLKQDVENNSLNNFYVVFEGLINYCGALCSYWPALIKQVS